MLATKTTPRPIANGPDIMRNFSDGAVIAVAERPAAIPAVYLKCLLKNPPRDNYNTAVNKNFETIWVMIFLALP